MYKCVYVAVMIGLISFRFHIYFLLSTLAAAAAAAVVVVVVVLFSKSQQLTSESETVLQKSIVCLSDWDLPQTASKSTHTHTLFFA